jgi:signal transduction histidine kinase/DNA-binding response OmpR family regulator
MRQSFGLAFLVTLGLHCTFLQDFTANPHQHAPVNTPIYSSNYIPLAITRLGYNILSEPLPVQFILLRGESARFNGSILGGNNCRLLSYPLWARSRTASILFSMAIVTAIFFIIRFHFRYTSNERRALRMEIAKQTEHLKKANRLLEEQKQEIQAKNNKLREQNRLISELSLQKNRYFTNISHEFRNLITLIKSPIENLIRESRIPRKCQKDLEIIQRNSGRLIELVNQLLDISKLDRGKMKLKMVEMDVYDLAHAIAISFTSWGEAKGINYRYHIPNDDCLYWFDADKFEKILSNLLSNAFKFTDIGGTVTVDISKSNHLDYNQEQLEIKVIDNGPGITEEEQQKIFDRFYQIEYGLFREKGGTGLGLALAHELVNLMKGTLKLVSSPGKGSEFVVKIPLGLEQFKEDEYTLISYQEVDHHNHESPLEEVFPPKEPIEEKEGVVRHAEEQPLILVVEDHPEVRNLIVSDLMEEYRVLEAVDGGAGISLATEHLPDLIITDLIMPRLDGIELCKKLKNNILTSHIPIIVLTARSHSEDKMRGYMTGADDYIVKPFSMNEVHTRVKNLIEQRNLLKARYSEQVFVEPSGVVITPLDKRFLNRAIKVVEKHISDDSFDVSHFCKELSMSRSTLFRKLEALTGQSPLEFIRTIRLKRAASLLMQRYGNISEIALQVGYKNPSYFAKLFRMTYSVSPKEYANSM